MDLFSEKGAKYTFANFNNIERSFKFWKFGARLSERAKSASTMRVKLSDRRDSDNSLKDGQDTLNCPKRG